MLHRLAITTVLLVALGACSRGDTGAPVPSSQTPDPLASEPWHPGVAHQQCEEIAPRIASVGELADSAAIASAAGAVSGHALWTIAFDRNGVPAEVRVLESTSSVDADRLTAIVRESLRPQAGETYVRLRLDADDGSGFRLRVGGVQYCHATLLNLDAVRLAMGAVDRDGVVELELYIDQQGRVQERELKTSSGVESTDRMVIGLVSGMQYSPARLERLAVPSRLSYRVDLNQR